MGARTWVNIRQSCLIKSQLCLSFTLHLAEKKDGPFIRPTTVNICVLIVFVVVVVDVVIVIGTYNGQSINDIICD